MRVALVHDWLVARRGGEKVLEAIAELYPEAEIFTLLHRPGAMGGPVEARRIHTSFLQRIPSIHRRYRHFLPLMPAAAESLDLRGFELVISSSHCVAKGVRIPEGARHLCYVHAPMRYMWDLFDDYFGPGRASLPVRLAAHAVRPYLRSWDRRSALGVHRFVANSHHIAAKVRAFYGREASVVHPPVDLSAYASSPLEGVGRRGYFLWVGAFAPYKRLDLAIDAFAALGLPLWVVGSGPGEVPARRPPANVRFLGQVGDAALARLYQGARALVFTAEEDFGITPLEAQASGRPVIAYGRGGALETVRAETGLFFEAQTVPSLVAAVRRFESWEAGFQPEVARGHALRFSKERFQRELAAELSALLERDSFSSPPADVR